MDIAMILGVTYGVLLVILGLNALIVVHEFGHFALARLCGVRCEKFYVWFDFWGLRFFRFKWGNTEYGLGLFPLGGYLKMLGQEDNPGAIRAEIERAKMQDNADAPQAERLTEETTEDETTEESRGLCPRNLAIFAPDSYLSKNVPQRLSIIVAGVVMNFLFAIVCAAGAYLIGVKEAVPAVGGVMSGSPAWEAGLQTGDRITAIDGVPARAFGDVTKKMIEGSKTVQFDIDRHGEALSLPIFPRKHTGDLHPRIGILPLSTLELWSDSGNPPVYSRWRKFYSVEALKTLSINSAANPFRLSTVDGQPVGSYAEYQDAQLKKIGLPITCGFTQSAETKEVVIPAIPMREIPVRFQMGTISAVLTGSDAENQGIKAGDTIVSVDGKADIDPLKLPQILLHKINAGQEKVELVIRKSGGGEQPISLALKPIRCMMDLTDTSMQESQGSTALGLSWNVAPVIAAVDESALRPDQPVPTVGEKVVCVEFVNSAILFPKGMSFIDITKEGFAVHSIGKRVEVPYIFTFLLQRVQPQDSEKGEEEKILSVRLTLEDSGKNVKVVELPISEATDWFQLDRGFSLKTDLTTFKAKGIGEALSLGTDRMIDFSLLVYKSVNALINGTVSARALNGPVGIVMLIYEIAKGGWSEYLMLLCLIGANLAVINLLPIPPLDGGHVVFLLYEGVFRRPPNELVQVVLSYLGLFLIILLMVWTVSLDLSCVARW